MLKGLPMREFYLDNFKVTQDGSMMVVTYIVRVQELIDGKHTLAKPAQRLSVFVKLPGGWKWLAHANFTALTNQP